MWDFLFLVCVMEFCFVFDFFFNVIIDSGMYCFGDFLVFCCFDGYDLLGSKMIVCIVFGMWSFSVFNC